MVKKKALSLALVFAMTLSLVVPAFAYGEDTSETIATEIEDRLEQEAITDTNTTAGEVQEAADTANTDVGNTEPEMSILENLVSEMAKLPDQVTEAVQEATTAASEASTAAGAVSDAYNDGVQAVKDRDQEALDAQKAIAIEQRVEAETAKNEAVQIYNDAKAAVDAAEKALTEAKAEENMEQLQEELTAAQEALDAAEAERKKAETQYAYARVYEATSAVLATTKDGFDGVAESDALMKILNELVGEDGQFRDEDGNLTINYNPAKNELLAAGKDVYHEIEGAEDTYAKVVENLDLIDMVLAAVSAGNDRVDLVTDVNPKMQEALKAKMEAKFGKGFAANFATAVAMGQFGFKHEKFLDLTTDDQDTVLLLMHAMYNAGVDPDGRTEILAGQSISNKTITSMAESLVSKSGSPIAGEDILNIYAKITDDVVDKYTDAAAAKEAVEKAMSDYDAAQKAVEKAQARLNTLKANATTSGSVKHAEADLQAAKEELAKAETAKNEAITTYDKAYADYVATIALSIDYGDDDDDNDNSSPDTTNTTTIDDTATPLTEGPVTRSQFLDYLWRYMTCPEFETACPFTDVTAEHEYFSAMSWAADTEIAKAFEDGTFQPDELVTVKAVREFLTNFAKAYELDTGIVAKLTALTGEGDDPVLNCGQVLDEFFALAGLKKAD